MRLFVILFLLGGCASGGFPSKDPCITWIHDVCHCRANNNKTVWWPEPTNWEAVVKACGSL